MSSSTPILLLVGLVCIIVILVRAIATAVRGLAAISAIAARGVASLISALLLVTVIAATLIHLLFH